VDKYDWSKGYLLRKGTSGKVHFGGKDGTGVYHYVNSSTIADDGNWHHVICIMNVNRWEIWIDGTMEAFITTSTSSPNIESTVELAIGYSPKGAYGTPDYFFDGKIDDLLIFNRALTTEEINILSGVKR